MFEVMLARNLTRSQTTNLRYRFSLRALASPTLSSTLNRSAPAPWFRQYPRPRRLMGSQCGRHCLHFACYNFRRIH